MLNDQIYASAQLGIFHLNETKFNQSIDDPRGSPCLLVAEYSCDNPLGVYSMVRKQSEIIRGYLAIFSKSQLDQLGQLQDTCLLWSRIH